MQWIDKPFPTGAGGRPWGIADGDLMRIVTPVGGQARAITITVIAALLSTACGSDDENTTATADVEGAETTDLSGQAPVSDGIVRPGRATWPTGYFQDAVYSALLEELGYTVADPAENEYPPAEAYSAMAEGVFDFWGQRLVLATYDVA